MQHKTCSILKTLRASIIILIISALTLQALSVSARSPQDYYEVLIGGIQIYVDVPGSRGDLLCSIGFPAYYYVPPPIPDRPGYYVFGFVTASHCGEELFNVYQPNISDQRYYRGFIDVDPSHPRLTDSAFVMTESSYDASPATVDDKVLCYGTEIPILGYITVDALGPNTVLYKTGRTTGTTYGLFVGVEAFTAVDFDGETIVIEHGIKALFNVDSGDSGGSVYLVERFAGSNYAWVVGIVNGYHLVRYDAIWVKVAVSSPYNDTIADLGVEAYG